MIQVNSKKESASSELDALALEMHEVVHELIKKYQFRDRNRICCHDVTVSQCYILYELRHKALPMRVLATRLDLDLSTVSRVVNQLEKKAYVERRSDPADGRIVLAALTDAGRDVLQRIEAELVASERQILEQISPAARHGVLFALRELLHSVDRWRTTCCATPPGSE